MLGKVKYTIEPLLLTGAASSCIIASALSAGSWPAVFGTATISLVSFSTSALASDTIAQSLEDTKKTLMPDLSTTELCAFAVAIFTVSFVLVNTLALSTALYSGLPIAPLSFSARVFVSVVAIDPTVLYTLYPCIELCNVAYSQLNTQEKIF